MTCPPCTHDCEQGKTCPAKSNNEIIAMARQAGARFSSNPDEYDVMKITHSGLKAFAKLVAAKEREACAKVADGYVGADPIADAIRARGQS